MKHTRGRRALAAQKSLTARKEQNAGANATLGCPKRPASVIILSDFGKIEKVAVAVAGLYTVC